MNPLFSEIMKKLFIIICILISYSCFAQTITKKDSIKQNKIDMYHTSIFYYIHQSWAANRAPSYLGIVPYTTSINNRRIPLLEGEGANGNTSLVEGNIALQFPLLFGRKDYGTAFRRLNKLSFDYNTNFRMTLDESKPLTPPSNKVGFTWQINLWNNSVGGILSQIGKDAEDEETYQIKDSTNFKFVNLLTQVHHYSNGESGESTITVPDQNGNLDTRNNYKNGDFSTNYFYWELTFGVYCMPVKSLHQLSIGHRWDWAIGETLSFSDVQIDSYGRHRVFFKYDYRTGTNRNFNHHIRLEFEYILDNVDKFRANLINDSKKYRLGSRAIFEITPKNHRSIGYFIQGYYGRDYLNIRFDEIIVSIQAGITLSLDKYFIPGF